MMLSRSRRWLGSLAVIASAALTPCVHAGGPVNDECTGALTIPLGDTAFSTLGSTTSSPAACGITRDIWFRYDSTFTGTLIVSTCGQANYDTIITVYRGCGCGSYNLIACNDQGAGCANTSILAAPVEAGRCYKIRVGGYQNQMGVGTLTLDCTNGNQAACADRIVTGADTGDRFGWSLARAGQVNADAIDDIIVGAYRNDTGGTDTGRGYVFTGSNLAQLYTLNGDDSGDNFGLMVSGGVDIDQDGHDELIVGALFNDDNGTDAGKAYVFSGIDKSLMYSWTGVAAGDRFGRAVAPAGDANDDGVHDVIVGAPNHDSAGVDAGRVYVFSGATGGLLWTADGQAAGDNFGFSVAPVGDLNDDGHGDVVVGAPKNDAGGSNAGRIYLHSGANGAVLQRIKRNIPGDQFGTCVAGKRFNVGSEVQTYVLAGAPKNDGGGSNAGRAYLFWRNHDDPGAGGCSGMMCQLAYVQGSQAGGHLGSSVALGDVHGDATPEFIIGAPKFDKNGSNRGRAYVFSGSSGALLRTLTGEAAGDQFGQSVAVPGDINADGTNDVAVGGPLNDAGGVDAGRVYVFFSPAAFATWEGEDGDDAAPIARRSPDLNDDDFVDEADLAIMLQAWGAPGGATSLHTPGDLNGDGAVSAADLAMLLAAWTG